MVDRIQSFLRRWLHERPKKLLHVPTFVESPSRVAVLLAVVIGVFVRFWGLGIWPLNTDEYFFTQSILNIQSHGLPKFECGGFYVRGLLQQYLTIPFMVFSTDVEWAARVPAVMGNLLGIPAVFILGRRLGGSVVACGATVLFCLSVWEIEFARFARMYALFQTVFLWYLVFLARAIVDKDRSALVWMYAISFGSLFIYEGAILMMCLNFLPFITSTIKLSVKQALINLTLLVSAVGLRAIDFRHLGALNSLPEEVARTSDIGISSLSLPISLPILLVTTMPSNTIWLAAALIPLAISLWSLMRLCRSDARLSVRLFWFSLIVCSAFNLFGILILGAVLVLVLRLVTLEALRQSFSDCGKAPIVAVLVNLAYWLIFTATTVDWIELIGEAASANYLQNLFAVMVDFPNIYQKVVYPWATAMPIMTVVSLLIIGAATMSVILRADRATETLRLLVFTLILMVVIVSSLETPFDKARYTFFLYPVLLLIISAFCFISALKLFGDSHRSMYAYWAFVGIVMLFSEDYSYNHLRNISSPEVNFRTLYESERQDMYFYRRDYSSPAFYVNENSQSEDIIVSPLMPSLSFYLNRLDYVYLNRSRPFFRIYAACDGTREIWSGSLLVYDEERFYFLIKESKVPVWLIMYSDKWRGVEERLLSSRYEEFRVFTNADATIDVYHIPPVPRGNIL